jgi:hypothetical protein
MGKGVFSLSRIKTLVPRLFPAYPALTGKPNVIAARQFLTGNVILHFSSFLDRASVRN